MRKLLAAVLLLSACDGGEGDDSADDSMMMMPPPEEECMELPPMTDTIISTAAELAALAGTEVLEGNLIVTGTELQDLVGLESLSVVKGALTIDSPTLRSLDGLQGLTRVHGSFVLTAPRVATTAPLSSLARVCEMRINGDMLSALPLPALLRAQVLSIGAVPQLEELSLPLEETGSFFVANAPVLHTVAAPALQKVVQIYFSELPALSTVDLGALREITDEAALRLPSLPGLTLPSLESVRTIDIAAIHQIELPMLRSGGAVVIFTSTVTGSFAAPVLESLTHSLTVTSGTVELPVLQTIGSGAPSYIKAREIELAALQTVDSLSVDFETLSMSSLQVAGDLRLGSRAAEPTSLPVVEAVSLTLSRGRFLFPNLTMVGALSLVRPEGEFTSECDPRLLNFPSIGASLPVVASLGGLIVDCVEVTELDAPMLTSIEGGMTIVGAEVLADLSGLSALERIGAHLDVHNNTDLAGLDLDALMSVGALVAPADAAVIIVANRSLPECEANALVARLTAAGFDGTATVNQNDTAATCP